VAEDNCEVASVTQYAGPAPGQILSVGTYDIGYEVIDGSGNVDTCAFVVEVIDVQQPIIGCPQDITIAADAGVCSWTSLTGSLTPSVAIENCEPSLTYIVTNPDGSMTADSGDVSGYIFALGLSTVEYTLTDSSGTQTTTCSFTVSVVDDEDPTIVCPADETFSADMGTCESVQATLTQPTVSDNCSVDPAVTYVVTNPDNSVSGPFVNTAGYTFALGTSQVAWTVVDTAGNTATCIQNITVTDDEAPMITCPVTGNVAIGTSNLGNTGDCAGTYEWTHSSPTDNCEIALYNYRVLRADGGIDGPFDLLPLVNGAPAQAFNAAYDFPLGTSTVQYYVEDESGNTDVCQFTVTVSDDEAPSFVNCPADTITVGNDFSNCEGGVNWSIPVAEDNCEVASVTQYAGPAPGQILSVGTYDIGYEVIDGSGNVDTCAFVVEVIDVQQPIIGCPQDITIAADAGVCSWTSLTGSLTPSVAIENCEPSLTYIVTNPDGSMTADSGDVSGYIFALGLSTVEYTLTDSSGTQTTTCSFRVTVVDEEDPTITCPSDVTFSTDMGTCESVQASLTQPVVSDNCSVNPAVTYTVTNPDNSISGPFVNTAGYTFALGTSQVAWTVVDTAGNTAVCVQNITVIDDEAPVIDCPVTGNVAIGTSNLGNTGDCAGTYEWTHSSPTDNCEIALYNYRVLRSDGGIDGPFDLLPLVNGAPAQAFNASYDFSLGTSTVQYFVEDGSGNIDVCQFTVTVSDDEDPSFVNCPATDILVSNDANECSANVSWSIPVADDNCGVTSVVQIAGQQPGSSFDVNMPDTITYVAYDAAGNTDTCTFRVLVEDTEEPNAICKDTTLYLDVNGMASVTAADMDGGSSDNCGVDMITLSQESFDCSDIGVQNAVLVVSDVNGNIDSCIAAITVLDTIAPTLSCPDSLTVSCDGSGNTTELNNWLATANATDNCDTSVTVTSLLFNTISGCGGTETQVWEFTAADGSGNESVCYAVFTIIDTIAPTITVAAQDLTVQCDGNQNVPVLIDWLNNNGFAAATDVCSSITWSNNYGTFAPGACDGTSGVDVTFYATDDCGNVDSTTATLTIIDTLAPVFVIDPVDITIECDSTGDPNNQIMAWLDNVGGADAFDSCSVIVYTNDYTGLTGGCGGNSTTGSALVTFTATDACGNTTTRQATVSVVDSVAPVITLPAQDTIVECDGGGNTADLGSWLGNNGNAEAYDLCGDLTWNTPVLLNTVDNCGGTLVYTYEFSATDECGNVSSSTVATFTIQDTTPPMITVPAMDSTVICNGIGNGADLNGWLALNGGAEASDVCGNVTWTYDLVQEIDLCSTTGSGVYRFTVTDECGNTSTTEATYMIIDTIAPVFTSPATDITVVCDGNQNVTELLDWLNGNGGATATDNCDTITWTNNYGTLAPGACDGTGSVEVIFTATDLCGNMTSDTATLTIIDTIAPVFVIDPVDITIECDSTGDPNNQIMAWLDNVGGADAFDSCSVIVYTNDYTGLTGGCGGNSTTGSALVTFTATDACGNTTTRQATVSVVDSVAPVITLPAQDTIVECDGGGNTADLASWLGNNGNAEAYDLCGDLTWNTPVLLNTVDNCGGTLVYTYEFSATDECGNVSSSTVATFTIQDTTPPMITVPAMDSTVICNGIGNGADLNGWLALNGGAEASDVCGNVTWTYNLVQEIDLCSTTGSGVYRFTVTDECGNTSTTEATYMIIDTIAPVFTSPATDITVVCDGNQNVTELLDWLNGNGGATATDNCDTITWTNNYGTLAPGACDGTGSVEVIFTATDLCGNMTSDTATLTIIDTIAPVFVIDPVDITIECDSTGDPNNQIMAWLDNVGGADAFDSCSVIVYTNDYTGLTGGCGGNSTTGSALVTFTATDACGNTTTRQATVSVVDSVAPVITLPAQDTIVECDGGGNTADLASWLGNNGNAEAYDLCGDLTWNTPALLNTVDNCGGTLVYTYEFSATDECGNVSASTVATFTIQDTTPPMITVPAMDSTVICNGIGNGADLNGWLALNGGAEASDICGNVTWTYDLVQEIDLCSTTGSGVYRFTVTDECGNTSTTEATYMIIDTVPPLLTSMASDITVVCDGNQNVTELLDWLNSNGGATATDNCDTITWTNNYGTLAPGACDGTGSVEVIFTATDLCGNMTSDTATLFIIDTIPPVFVIDPADLSIQCDENDDPLDQIDAWLSTVGGADAFDSCSVIVYTNDFSGLINGCGGTSTTGEALVTFTATDACGNTTTRQAMVNVVDSIPPAITSPAIDTIVECDGIGNIALLSAWLADNGGATASDRCGAIFWNTPVLVQTIEGCGRTVEYVYSFTADDECGNESAATIARFTIIDTTPPVSIRWR
jgi:hypothetical protein